MAFYPLADPTVCVVQESWGELNSFNELYTTPVLHQKTMFLLWLIAILLKIPLQIIFNIQETKKKKGRKQ